MTLYKYRSLHTAMDFERFIQISQNNTLYGSRFDMLNDPMEGYFECVHKSAPSVVSMNERLKDALICSLSEKNNIGLMWSHYADEHKGCCLEVELDDTLWKQ